jgi:hypothetical protein
MDHEKAYLPDRAFYEKSTGSAGGAVQKTDSHSPTYRVGKKISLCFHHFFERVSRKSTLIGL